MSTLIDSLPETQYGDYWYLGPITEYLDQYPSYGQSFVAIPTYAILSSAKFYLKKYNSPTGNVYAKIYNATETHGINAVPIGEYLAISDPIDVGSISQGSYGLFTFTFSDNNKIKLVHGNPYIICVEFNGGNSANALIAGFSNNSSFHGGNVCKLSGTTWTAGAPYGYDEELIFYVYGEPIPSDFNYFDQKEIPSLILCSPNKEERYSLGGEGLAYNIKNTLRYNAMSELTFDFPMSGDGGDTINVAYGEIKGKMLVLVTGVGYYIIQDAAEDLTGSVPIKNVSCVSLEAEMLARRLSGFDGTYQFQDLLQTILDIIPTWTIGTIDPVLLPLYRHVASNNSTVYNFLMTEVEKAYACIFTFDSFTRTVSAKSNAFPAVNTNIYLSFDNLASEIQYKEISDEICTALYCYGGGSLDIHSVNPLGTNVIYDFHYFKTAQWMSQGLIDALTTWEALVISKQTDYADKLTTLSIQNASMLELEGDLLALLSELQSMRNVRQVKLEQGLSVTEIDESITDQQILIASKNIDMGLLQQLIADSRVELRKIVFSLYFTSSISYTNFENDVEDINSTLNTIKSTWANIYNQPTYPGFDLAYYQSKIPVINGLIIDAIEQNTILLNYIASGFSSYPAPETDILILIGYINDELTILNNLYFDLQSIINTTSVADSIEEITAELTAYIDIISYSNNMSEAQYLELCTYIYENTYINKNIITTDIMTEVEEQAQAQDLYDQSQLVLAKAAIPRYEFNGKFSNFIALDNFSFFTNELTLGSGINIQKDNILIQAVLLELAVTYDNPTDFEMTFGNTLRLDNASFIYGDLLGMAAQLGANFDVETGVSATNIATGGGLITLASNEHGLLLNGTVLDFWPFSTHYEINSDGKNIWIGGGGQNATTGGGSLYKGSYNVSLGMNALLSSTTGWFNTAVGYDALKLDTEGRDNVAVGTGALDANLIGNFNTAIGSDALGLNVASDNTAVGASAMAYNITGSGNVAVGVLALNSNSSGDYNTAVGYCGLKRNTTGASNTANGVNALYQNIDGYSNTANGVNALYQNIDGHSNVAIGLSSLRYNTSGYRNTATGNLSLYHNTIGYENTANGSEALYANIDGRYNVAIGRWALYSNTSGIDNTGSGRQALFYNTTGNYNTAIGSLALFNLNITNSTGGNNTAIGYYSGGGITTGVNNTIIGANVTGLASALSDTVILADGAGLIRFYSDATYKGKLQTAITSAKTLTLTSANTYNLTIPRTGTVGMVEVAASEPTGLYAGFIWIDI